MSFRVPYGVANMAISLINPNRLEPGLTLIQSPVLWHVTSLQGDSRAEVPKPLTSVRRVPAGRTVWSRPMTVHRRVRREGAGLFKVSRIERGWCQPAKELSCVGGQARPGNAGTTRETYWC